jgi:hypothetical protein
MVATLGGAPGGGLAGCFYDAYGARPGEPFQFWKRCDLVAVVVLPHLMHRGRILLQRNDIPALCCDESRAATEASGNQRRDLSPGCKRPQRETVSGI